MLHSRLLIIIAAVLWSTAGAAMKLCQLSGPQIACGRSLVAGAFIWLAVPEARRAPTRRTIAVACAYAATVVLFSLSNKLTTAANAIFIQSTAPLWVLVLSPALLGERPARAQVLAVPVYGVGLALFFLDDLSPGQLAGNLLALCAGLSFGLNTIGLRRFHADGAGALVWGNLLAVLLTAPFVTSGPLPQPSDLALLLYLGVFQLGLAYVCFARAVRHLEALEASLLVLLEPVLNPIWTFIFAGERPGPWALAGGGIVVLATLWRTLAPRLSRSSTDLAPEP